ncbi:GNAT family N-acetyltransferase [Noviherbaspirillum sp. CPCC 100848]|uniref:GNAT family N-acetyltransferase n=1 Tax=Noviherbaspirillum album TaxID=3080276 RepID=A0ABU6JFL4_9BURK|nr:GNAT family N-acetyltransferase [Noviherbaspirillum sp. CPCC 100848]MEC4721889.1 GNAT family N-acetyltransferase [Noviherbaspirillum sp. CPCC 100848]
MEVPHDPHGAALSAGMAFEQTAGSQHGALSSRADEGRGGEEVQVFAGVIPPFAEWHLERLYGTLYSSLAYFRTCDTLDGVHTYVAGADGELTAILLYRVVGATISVVNEGMCLPEHEVQRFCSHMFARHASAAIVRFHAVQVQGSLRAYPRQRFLCAEDFIAALPPDEAGYLAALGSATRKNIKRHRNRLQRDYPGFDYRVAEKEGVDEAHVRAIIEMNRARMRQKNKSSFIDEEETLRILRLVRACGKVGVASIDGRIVGGAIVFHVGSSFISKVNAHDAAYDDYRLGMLCCYLTVCAAIERGCTRFHFGHGRYAYKTALLGTYQPFEQVLVYRSPATMATHCRTVLRTAFDGVRMEGSRWVLERAEQGEGAFWRPAGKLLAAWRGHRRGNEAHPG